MGYILNRQAVEVIARRLNLPATGQEQDWDIELADPTRLREFLSLYNQAQDFSESEKYALMALILASCDDAIQDKGSINKDYWEEISAILQSTPHYRDLIDSWALPREINVNNQYSLTPYMRLLKVI